MISPRLRRAGIGVMVGASLLGSSGCSAVRAVAGALSDEAPPGVTRTPESPLSGPSSSSDPSGASVGDAIRAAGGDGAAPSSGSATSVYVVSPALTWGALQLHRPHAITGSLFPPGLESGPECRAQGWAPFEITAQPNRLFAEEVVRSEHVPFGIRSSFTPIESVLTLDPDVMADHMMRSGAYLVQRGPVCFESLFISAFWTIGGHTRGSDAEAYW